MKLSRLVSLLAIFLLTSITASSQLVRKNLYAPSHLPRDIQLVDIDGDGDQDILSIGSYGQLVWYENFGSGEFSEQRVIREYGESAIEKLGVGDFDQDGDIDFVTMSSGVVQNSDDLILYQQVSPGLFGETILLEGMFDMRDLEVADMDLDGDPDILISRDFLPYESDEIQFLENLGDNEFSEPVVIVAPESNSIYEFHVGDFNHDGHLDVMRKFGLPSGQADFFLNDGGMNFTHVGSVVNSSNFYFSNTADIDGDGDLDLYPVTRCSWSHFIEWSENTGEDYDFRISDVNSYDLCHRTSTVSDIDGDGDLDRVFMLRIDDEQFIRWHEFDEGNFQIEYQTLFTHRYNYFDKILSSDFNGDSFDDLLLFNRDKEEINVLLNDGEGGFLAPKEITATIRQSDMIAQDIDLDGITDICINSSSSFDNKLWLYRGLGGGEFDSLEVLNNDFPLGTTYFADIDNDSDLDAVGVGYSNAEMASAIYWLSNDGEPLYSGEPNMVVSSVRHMMIGDYDQDGDTDIIYQELVDSFIDDTLMIAVNDGEGQFSLVLLGVFDVLQISNISQYDFNGDGYLDLFFSGKLDGVWGSYWLENNGDMTFGPPQYVAPRFDSLADEFAFADFDGDDDLDVIIHDKDPQYVPTRRFSVLHVNDGDGNFTSADTLPQLYTISGSSTHTAGLFAMDYNGDGAVDLITRQGSSHAGYYFFQNFGNGTFDIPQLIYSLAEDGFFSYGLADVDLDEDVDLIGWYMDPIFGTVAYNGYLENKLLQPQSARGRVYADLDQNGVFDGVDFGLNTVNIQSTPLSDLSYTYGNGEYYLSLDQNLSNVYEIFPEGLEGWELTSDSSSYTVGVDDSFFFIDNLDFGFYPDSVYTDVAISLVSGFPRCNDEVNLWVELSNAGASVVSGNLCLELDSAIQFQSASFEADSIVDQKIYWHFDDLSFYQSLNFNVEVVYPPFTSLGDTLRSELSFVEFGVPDSVAFQDSVVNEAILVCAYDPNDKAVSPQGFDSIGYIGPDEELSYLIRFQNTGNDTAITVIVEDQLSAALDYTTFEPISSSHGMQVYLNDDGKLEFAFYDIMLPDSNVDFLGSQGYVEFRISPLPGLVPNTPLFNMAEIYFDYNPAIVTNTVQNTIECYIAPNPLISFIYPALQAGDTGTQFQWYLNGELIEGATSNTWIPEVNGEYTVEIEDVNGCSTLATPFEFSTLAVNDQENQPPIIFPNPSTGLVYLDLGQQDNRLLKVDVYDLQGKLLFTENGVTGGLYSISEGNLENGAYLLFLSDQSSGEVIFSGKFIVRH